MFPRSLYPENEYIVKTMTTQQYFLTLPQSASVLPSKYEKSPKPLPLHSTNQSS